MQSRSKALISGCIPEVSAFFLAGQKESLKCSNVNLYKKLEKGCFEGNEEMHLIVLFGNSIERTYY